MMGESVSDPDGIEGDTAFMPGLGLLPVRTTLEKEKQTRQCTFRYRDSSEICKGYEIHMGRTDARGASSPVNLSDNGHEDGYFVSEKCWGTYMHGILDNPVVIENILKPYLKGDMAKDSSAYLADYQTYKEMQYDKLADMLRKNLNMTAIYDALRILPS
jgi:adenosylcobyric acid synthase